VCELNSRGIDRIALYSRRRAPQRTSPGCRTNPGQIRDRQVLLLARVHVMRHCGESSNSQQRRHDLFSILFRPVTEVFVRFSLVQSAGAGAGVIRARCARLRRSNGDQVTVYSLRLEPGAARCVQQAQDRANWAAQRYLFKSALTEQFAARGAIPFWLTLQRNVLSSVGHRFWRKLNCSVLLCDGQQT